MKPLYIQTCIVLLLFSCHIRLLANNNPERINGLFTMSSFSPMAAKAGDTIQITGTGFSGITSVSFGGVPAASFVVTSPTTIRAYVGAGASGNLVVSDGVAVDSLGGFVYQSAPLIQSVSPAQGLSRRYDLFPRTKPDRYYAHRWCGQFFYSDF